MSWNFLPVAIDADMKAEQIEEIRTGINERCTAVGIATMATPVNIDDDLSQATLLTFQQKIETLLTYFWDSINNQLYTKTNLFTQAVIGNGIDWTRVPSRLASAIYGNIAVDDDCVIENINELMLALNKLTGIKLSSTE